MKIQENMAVQYVERGRVLSLLFDLMGTVPFGQGAPGAFAALWVRAGWAHALRAGRENSGPVLSPVCPCFL